MLRKTICVCLSAAIVACIAGCEPKVEGYKNPLDVMETRLPQNPKDKDYVLARMEFAEIAMMLGCYYRAEPVFENARQMLESEQSNAAAAVGSERHKYYKGETYERAFLCNNLGFIRYYNGDYNNARIYFSNAINEDRKAVVKEDTPPIYGDDFGLAYFWLGKAYLKLGDVDNARVAFKKAALNTSRGEDKDLVKELAKDRKEYAKMQKKRIEGEQWCWDTFSNPKEPELKINGMADLAKVTGTLASTNKPMADATKENPVEKAAAGRDEFFTPDFQKQANLVMAIEVGQPPYKELAGAQNEITRIKRTSILPHTLRVYIDGYPAGEAYRVLDLWDQATTQDRVGEKDAAQVTKAILKTIADQFISTGWDVSGDIRYWHSLPGRVYVSAAKVKPGLHRVHVEMYDINGNVLPRWGNTYSGILVPEKGEYVLLTRPYFDCNNNLSEADIEKAKKEKAQPYGWKN